MEYTFIKYYRREKYPDDHSSGYRFIRHIQSFNDLKQKEVINVCDGRRLGYVCNVEFEVPGGQIVAISVPTDCRCFNFGRIEETRIPWCNIEKIGADTVIVNVGFIQSKKDNCCDK